MADAAIRAEGLTKYYGEVIGIEDLSFDVAPGEVYGFLGANGAGKTTTIRLLLDLLRPSRGRATVLGVDCQRDSLAARRLIGYLPGDLPIYPDLSAGSYLAYLARLDDRRVPAGYLQHLLERFDVSEVDQRRRLRVQSHGMKQKIGIIQALMARPAVAILDEPTAGLDPMMVQAFRETVAELKADGQTTVFLSSHVLAEVESTCDRIGLVRGGRLVTTGTIEQIKRDATRRVTAIFDAPVPAPAFTLPGVTVRSAAPAQWVAEVRGPIGPFVATLAGLPLRDLVVDPFKLEDYIAQFYGGRAMIALLVRSASQARYLLLSSFALLFGFQLIIVGQAAQIERNQSFSRMADLLPGFLQRGLGSKAMLLATFRGTVAFGYFHPVVGVLVAVVAMYVLTEPAHEVESGLVDLELARAVPRHRLLTRSVLLAAGSVGCALLVMFAGTALGGRIFDTAGMDLPSRNVRVQLLLHLGGVAACFGGYALLLATLSRRWTTSFTTAVLTAVVLYLVDFLAIGWPPMRAVSWISPFHYYPALSVVAGDAPQWRNLSVLFGTGAGFVGAAYWQFNRRDL